MHLHHVRQHLRSDHQFIKQAYALCMSAPPLGWNVHYISADLDTVADASVAADLEIVTDQLLADLIDGIRADLADKSDDAHACSAVIESEILHCAWSHHMRPE